MGGKRPVGPCRCLHWAEGPAQGKKSLFGCGEEKPLLGHGESPPRHNVAEDGGGNLPPVVTLPIISWSGKSTKAEKDTESVERKGCHYRIQCLVLDTAIPLCPYNHS